MKNIKKVLIFVLFVFASVLALNLSVNVKAASQVTYDCSAPLTTEGVVLDENITVKISGTNTYKSPLRFYKNTVMTFTGSTSAVKITSIVFVANGSSYATAAMGATCDPAATASQSGNTVTYTLDSPAQEIAITAAQAQIRINSIVVNYENNGNLVQLATPVATLSGKTASWGAVANASGYNVKVTNKTFGDSVTYSTTNTSYTVDYANGGECEVTVVAVGDDVTYSNSLSGTAGTYTNEIPTISISEFLELEVADKNAPWYKLTGKVTNIVDTTYGNFTLVDTKDANVSVYVYGLTSTVKASNDKSFSSLEIVANEIISLYAYRAEYKGSPQVSCGAFVQKEAMSTLDTFKTLTTQSSMILNYALTKGDAIATSYSYDFTEQAINAAGTVILGDANWTVATDGDFFGYDSNKDTLRGQQIGSEKKPAKSLTLTSKDFSQITEIKVTTSGASSTNATLTVTVGGTQVGEAVALTKDSTEYTFTVANNGKLDGDVVLSYTQTSAKAIYIKAIKVEGAKQETTYALTSASLRFGTGTLISKEMYDEFAAQGAKWGVEIKAGEAAATQIACTPVRVNENGVEDANGEFYQFALVINKIGYANIDTILTAKVFVEINNTKTYMNEASHSLRTLVDTYLAANDKSAYEDHLGVLNHLSAYGK